MRPSDRYRDQLIAAAERGLGRPLQPGTTAVVDPERAGSGTASCYPLGTYSIVWCDAAVHDRVVSLESVEPCTAEEFVTIALGLGATLLGYGRSRVLDVEPQMPPAELGDLLVRHVRSTDEQPIAMLQDLIAACDPDDVLDAELDIDGLDPAYTVLVTPDDTIAAYASARPSELDPSFLDIAVLTRPSRRGERLGALAVHELIRGHRVEGRRWLYRCSVDNIGSNRVAESLGFELVTTIGAVAFPQ